MRRRWMLAAATMAVCWYGVSAVCADWAFRPSYYSHDPQTGQRLTQYAQPEPSLVAIDPTFQRSAYRHNETVLMAGGSADRVHVVETWGQGENLRPYGEWERPYRAGATPYGPWGNPQGPWTDPAGAWANPYGLGRSPYGMLNPNLATPFPPNPNLPVVPAPVPRAYRTPPVVVPME